MASTLSYGYIQPANGDKGSVWFPALNTNIQKLNDHTHNGSDAAQINAGVIVSGTVSILAAGWTLVEAGKYKQTVTVPAGFTTTGYSITVRLASTNTVIYPTIDYVSGTTFDIYTCDNTLSYTAVFR